MNRIPSRHRCVTMLVMLALLLTSLLGVQAGEPDRADPGPHPLPVAVFKVADQRVGLASTSEGNAENFVVPYDTTVELPLVTVRPGFNFRLYTLYEAVFFPTAGGQALFELAIYHRTPQGDVLLTSDQTVELGSGPRCKTGSLSTHVRLNDPGLYLLAIVMRSTANPVAGGEVLDEDEIVVWVLVQDDVTAGPREDATIEPVDSVATRELGSPSDPGWYPEDTLQNRDGDPIPIPTDRQMRVAYPRGHFLSSSIAAVENFDQGHGRVLIVRQGDTVTFQSAYEFVWFAGATGSGQTSLTIRLADGDEGEPPIGENNRDMDGQDGYRVAGVLEAPVLFSEAGRYAVIATVESRVNAGSGLDIVTHALDRVRVEVIVVGQPETGAISGTVTEDKDDVPLERIQIRVYQARSGRIATTVYTAEDGSYLATGLEPASYLVFADPLDQNYLPEWYDDAPNREDATPVEVIAGVTKLGIDLGLTPGGVISGLVIEDESDLTTPVIRPIGGVLITAGPYGENLIVARTITANDGSYRLEKLPAGSYWVHAANDHLSIIPEYWDDKETIDQADEVEVAAGQETGEIDFALRYGGTISGQVLPLRSPSPEEASDIRFFNFRVTAYDWDTGEAVMTVNVEPRGYYRIPSLPEGSYRVYAFDADDRYVPEYYDDVTLPEEASEVIVRRGAETKEIDFDLSWAGISIVEILPSAQQVQVGDLVTVTIGVLNVLDLGSFSFDLYFEPRILQAQSAQLGDLLGSTGREVSALGPTIDNENGMLTFGAFSIGEQAGPSGSGLLATITFEAVAEGESLLNLGNMQLLDAQGGAIPSNTPDARVRVGGCIFGDFDCDCDVDILDVMQVALRWGTVEGDPDYDATYDLDHDGDIDIVDVALVAAAWGNTCDDDNLAVEPAAEAAAGLQAKLLATGLRLEPPSSNATVGHGKMLQVWVDEVQDLAMFEFRLQYDATRLSVSAGDVVLGDFLGSTGRSVTQMGPDITVDGGVGTIHFGGMSLGFAPLGPDGSGVLAEITFTPLMAGEAALDFDEGKVANTGGQANENLALSGATMQISRPTGTNSAFMPLIQR